MDKASILDALRAKLAEELEIIRAAAFAAIEGATHEEAKAENEYDTRGLEQSYLAGAQTARAEALAAAIASLETFCPPALGEDDPIGVGACVTVDDGEAKKQYLLCEVGGGTKLEVHGSSLWVLTPQSPLGRRLMGRRVGDLVEHEVRGEPTDLEIVGIG